MFIPRSRSMSSIQPAPPFTYEEHTVGSGGTVNRGSYPSGSTGESKTISDCPHPGFRKAISSGGVVMGDLILTRGWRKVTIGSVLYSASNGYYVTYSGDMMAFLEPNILITVSSVFDDIPKMSSVALMNAMGKIRKNSVMSGEVLSDLGKTVGMLRHPLESSVSLTRRMLKSAKRGYGKTARSVTRANADAWLEYRYGWKPLLLDINQAAKNAMSFRDRLYPRRLVVRASEKGSRNQTISFSDAVVATPVPTGWKASGSVTYNENVEAHAGIMYEVSNRTTSEQISADYRLGVDSLAQTAWEVIPFSFVVDWFANVGGWLEAIVPNPGVSILGRWVTTKAEQRRAYTPFILKTRSDGSSIYEAGTLGSSEHYAVTVTRDTNPQLPPTPPLNLDFSSVTHAVDGASLLAQKVISGLGSLRH